MSGGPVPRFRDQSCCHGIEIRKGLDLLSTLLEIGAGFHAIASQHQNRSGIHRARGNQVALGIDRKSVV
jgi:hypothetical protein